jgi:hypothetical protein
MDCLSEAKFDKEDIILESKEGHLKQKYQWMICLIYEYYEVFYEQKRWTYSSPQMFIRSPLFQPCLGDMIIAQRRNSFETMLLNKKSWM